jgi:hypothetical protein
MINLAGGARGGIAVRESGTHVMIGEDIAGANDHRKYARRPIGTICNYPYRSGKRLAKKKISL